MICIIAGNYQEARNWAYGQMLDKDEWFYPEDLEALLKRRNFHVLVVGTAGFNLPQYYFEKLLQLAKQRGRIGR
jgi:hypothetical protein